MQRHHHRFISITGAELRRIIVRTELNLSGEVVSDKDLKEKLEALNEEPETLNAQVRELEITIEKTLQR